VSSDLDLLAHRVRPPEGEAQGLLVLLHGRGVDELDLLPLGDALDPERRLVVVTPRAPLRLPPGGAHWYAVQRVGFPDPPSFWSTFEVLGRWLDALPVAFGVPWERAVLGGFSQGTVMSYALGLGARRRPPAAVLALSGFIPTVEGFELELAGLEGYPVAIGHGTLDPVIPVEFGRAARERLEAQGLDVLYRESAMGHTIDPAFIEQLRPWLRQATTASARAH
jgi:phospholipase/carboxylesterase